MKVLISAYACEPGAGSEPGAGWEWSRAAAMDHDVWVMTRENNAELIEQELAKDPHLRLNPVYIDLPKWARWWKKGAAGVRVYYLLWQILAWRHARKLHREIRFDLMHHLSMGIDWLPAGVAFAAKVPFVWGPVGGSTHPPLRLWRWLGWRGATWEIGRVCVITFGRLTVGRVMAKRSSLLLAQNDDIALKFRYHHNVITEPHVAVDIPPPIPSRQLRHHAVFAGNLLPLKGLRLAIAAFGQLKNSHWRLSIYGDGKDAVSLKRLVQRSKLSDRISFLGRRPRGQVLEVLESADLFIFPSLHDSAGWAVAEALSRGCPVVCLALGGPAVMVRASGGAVVETSGRPDRELALVLDGALPQVTDRFRWGKQRLPEMIDGFYRLTENSPQKVILP